MATSSEFLFDGHGEMPKRFQRIDWSNTAMGPAETWPQSLRTTVSLMLNSQIPMFIAWGPTKLFLYNDAYIPVLGKKHPDALGKEFKILWSEIWIDLLPLVNSVDAGKAIYQEDLRFIMHRSGFEEEVFFTFSYSPIRDERGQVAGLFCACVDTTKRVKAETALQESLEEKTLSERELVDTLESMSDAFFSLDKNWKITRVNKQHEKVTNKSREEQIGKSILDVWFNDPKYEDSLYLKSYRKAMTERVPVTFVDYYAPLKFWTEVRVYPKSDGGIAVFFTDITERKTAQIEFEKSVDDSPAILWITGKDGSCSYLSKQWFEVTGQTSEDALGFGWQNATHPDDKQRIADLFTESNAQQKPFSAEYRLRSKSGEYRWAIDAGNPRYDKDGRYLGYAGTVFDIHEQKIAAEAVRDLNNRFIRSAKATDLGVWYCDLPFDVLIWNNEVKNHFFLPSDAQVTIDLFYEIIHPDDRESTKLAIQKSIDSKTPYDTIYRTRNPSNPEDIKSIRAVGWTDYDSNGNPKRFDGITLDVTSELVRRAELEAAKQDAERANQLKSAFLANMSHEIRTPIGAIMGFSDLARQADASKDDVTSYLSVVERNSVQVLRIIDDILDLAKVEAGRVDLEIIEVSLTSFLADFIFLMGFRARENGINFLIKANSDLPDRICTDPTRLRQVLTNAVGNAIKFTAKGSVILNVSFANDILEFDVVDTGRGISEKQSKNLFQAFVQADVSTTRKFGGTGLGLVLTKRLCQLMGGDYSLIKSELGHGSTFKAWIKVKHPKTSKLIQKDQVVFESVVNPGPKLDGRKLDGVSILLVEDSPDNQVLIRLILERQGAKVEIASDGQEGAVKALSGQFHAVLMDIQMPVMDGHEAVQMLRGRGFKTPVIAFTAHAMKEETEKAFRSGFTTFLTKPVQRDLLIDVISKLAGHG